MEAQQPLPKVAPSTRLTLQSKLINSKTWEWESVCVYKFAMTLMRREKGEEKEESAMMVEE